MVNDKRKILVAVDDSEVSAYAFTWGLHNLFSPDDHLIILNAAPFVGTEGFATTDLVGEYAMPMTPSPSESEAAQKEQTEKSKTLISKYINHCCSANISCEGEAVKGDPGSWIVDEAHRLNAHAVLVGSHAYGLIKRTLLGSISDYVLHNANCPVIIVRQAEELQQHDPLTTSGMPRIIVIAVDESKESGHAFAWAMKYFCKASDHVIIYHVHQPVPSPVALGEFGVEDVYVPPGDDVEEEVKALTQSEKLVEKYMEYVADDKKITCKGMVVTGQTEEKVCEGLISLKADAVVTGSQERSMLERTFLGSVSDYLAHNSPCPLLVVKTPKKNVDDRHPHVS